MEFRYRGLRATLEKATVTDAEVDGQILRMQQQNPRYTEVLDRAARDGDELVLDYAGFCGGTQFQGGTAQNQTLVLGSGTFIPGFEEQLVGCRPGDDVTVDVRFPEEYHADELAGKNAQFRCHVHAVRTRSMYELDDTFAKEIGECDTFAQMKENVRGIMQRYYDERSEMELCDRLSRQAAASLDYTPGPDEIAAEMDEQMQTLEAQLGQKGLTLEMYCQFSGMTMEQIREDIRPEAESNVRVKKAVDRIAELENLTITEEELSAALAEVAEKNRMTMEQLKPYMDDAFRAAVERSIMTAKVLTVIRNSAEVTVADAPAKA